MCLIKTACFSSTDPTLPELTLLSNSSLFHARRIQGVQNVSQILGTVKKMKNQESTTLARKLKNVFISLPRNS